MLQKENRLTRKSHFEEIRQNGKFSSTPLFSLSFLRRDPIGQGASRMTPMSRFGFIVSKKISKSAVIRNRIKRVLREIVDKNIEGMKNGYDMVFLVKSAIVGKSHEEVERQVNEALKKLDLKK